MELNIKLDEKYRIKYIKEDYMLGKFWLYREKERILIIEYYTAYYTDKNVSIKELKDCNLIFNILNKMLELERETIEEEAEYRKLFNILEDTILKIKKKKVKRRGKKQ